MKKTISLMLLAAAIGLISGNAAWAKPDRLKISEQSTISGVSIKPGDYKIKWIADDQIEILHRGNSVIKVAVEVQPIGDSTPNSVVYHLGQIMEIRCSNQRLVIINPESGTS